MSQARTKRRNNLRAGIFVSISIVLGLGVFTILTDAWSKLTTSVSMYSVTFNVSEGIGTLSSGSKVRLGGVLVGDVISVTPRAESDGPTSFIDVSFQLDSQYSLYTNATICSRAGLLGSTGWLAISDVGSGKIATEQDILIGSTETMVAQLLGRDAQVNISKSLAALRKISEVISDDGGALEMLLGEEESQALHAAIGSAKSGLESINTIMQSTEDAWPAWESSISKILTDSESIPSTVEATLQNVQEMVKDVRANILPNVEKSMQSLKRTMASLENMSATYEQSAPKWAADVTDILQNVEQISVRAEKAIDEISASPWRLLYRPTDREIAYEQLNAASWQLLAALTDLRDSVKILEESSLSENSPSNAAQLAKSLRESAQEFENARTEILERMKLDFPNR
ncbi:MAG: hypothetical protein HOC27_07610 [Phycisphaerae bacterium]|jgi:ABC-type transporter Mla subunit MlaD|nr:hypothetical protein [Phycisphaerae bacterium]